jgi:hypothetical protein
MRIDEFCRMLTSRGEQSLLFQALRRLTLLEDLQRMVVANADDGGDDGGGDDRAPGWMVWTTEPSGGSPSLRAKAEAV